MAHVNQERLWDDLMAIAAITEPDRPWTRRSFSPMFLRGRAFLRERLDGAGLHVRIDAGGNMIGRLDGHEPGLPTIAMGSHTDTVPAGGRFDGVAGVIAALEAARVLAEEGGICHPIEVIDCLGEEPSDFGPSCIGSRGIAAELTPHMLTMTDASGRTLSDALVEVGGDPHRIAEARRKDLAAFLELHIEQGPVLEAEAVDLGIVTAIVGIRRIEIEFSGEAAHAGTTPMNLRRDAGYAGALTIVRIREIAEKFASKKKAYFVATVGIAELKPGGSNVVPGLCHMVVDVRSSDVALTEAFMETLASDTLEIAINAQVQRTRLEVLSDGAPAICDTRLRAIIAAASSSLGRSAIPMASGAGHDAAFMARICPAAMIFIPCLKGISHNPGEYTSSGQLAIGTEVLLETVRRLDRIL